MGGGPCDFSVSLKGPNPSFLKITYFYCKQTIIWENLYSTSQFLILDNLFFRSLHGSHNDGVQIP